MVLRYHGIVVGMVVPRSYRVIAEGSIVPRYRRGIVVGFGGFLLSQGYKGILWFLTIRGVKQRDMGVSYYRMGIVLGYGGSPL